LSQRSWSECGPPGRLSAALHRARVDYQYHVYPGVGHAFLQTREKPEVADGAWLAIERFFQERLDR
jgi:dienelactone hydrolase